PLVFRWIDRLVGLDVVASLAVAIGIEDERRPALRLFLVTGLLEHFAVQPAYDAALGATCAGPQCVVGVLREDQVMGWKARADQSDLAGLWFVHRDVAVGALDGKNLGGGMFRAL